MGSDLPIPDHFQCTQQATTSLPCDQVYMYWGPIADGSQDLGADHMTT